MSHLLLNRSRLLPKEPTLLVNDTYTSQSRVRLFAAISAPFIMLVISTFLGVFSMRVLGASVFMAVLIPLIAETLTIAILYNSVYRGISIRQMLYLREPKTRHVILGLGVGVFLFLGLQIVAALVEAYSGDIQNSDTTNTLSGTSGLTYIVVFLIMVPIVVPFFEEVFFRAFLCGLILRSSLPARFRTITAVLFSSIVFALAHYQGMESLTDAVLVLWIFVIGVVNAILLVKTRSVFVCYLSHLAYNGITVMITVLASMGH